MKLFTKNENGFTLLGVLMVLAIFSILGFSILAVTAGSVKLSDNERDDQSVFYIAEAGLAEAGIRMNEEFNELLEKEIFPSLAENERRKPENRLNPEDIFYDIVRTKFSPDDFSLGKAGDEISFENHFGENPFAEVSITKKEENNEVRYEISSVGDIGGKKRVISQKVDVVFDSDFLPKPDDEEPGPISPLNSCFALYTSGSINAGSGTIDGDIYSTKKITISNSGASLNGSIYSTEDIEFHGSQGVNNLYSFKNILATGGSVKGNLVARNNVTITGSVKENGQKKGIHLTVGKDIIAGNNIMVDSWFSNVTGNYKYVNDIDFEFNQNKEDQSAKLKKVTKAEFLDIINSMGEITNKGKMFNNCIDKIPTLANEENVFHSKDGVPKVEDKTISGYNSNEFVNLIKDGSLKMIHEKTNNTVLDLTSDLYFKEIEITTSKKLYIDLKGETRTIYVDSLKMPNGHIELVNEGTLNIQVLNDLTFGAGSSIKNSDQSDTTNTNIFYAGNNPLMIDGGVNLKSSIHVKDANLTVTAGGGVHGDIYVYGENTVKVSGGSSVVEQVFLAPRSKFIHNNGTINGNVIAKEFEMSGGARIIPPKENNGSPSPESPSVPEEPEVEVEGKKFSLNFKEQVEK